MDTPKQNFLANLIETDLYPLLLKISEDVANAVKSYTDQFKDDEKALAEVIGDLSSPFWAHFSTATRACIVQHPAIDFQYLLVYAATNRSEKQLAIFCQAFDLIFTDLAQRLSGMESKKQLNDFIKALLEMVDREKLKWWQTQQDGLPDSFVELLKRVVFAPECPYASIQRDALDVLLMMRPFLNIELSDRQNTNQLVQQSFCLLERATMVHRFDIIRALSDLYPELSDIDFDVDAVIQELDWKKEDMISNLCKVLLDKNEMKHVIDKVEAQSSGKSTIATLLRCKERLKSTLNIDLNMGMLFNAFRGGRININDMMTMLSRLQTAIGEERDKDDEEGDDKKVSESKDLLGLANLDMGEILSQIMLTMSTQGLEAPALD